MVCITILAFVMGREPHRIPVALYSADTDGQLAQQFIDTIDSQQLQAVYYPSNESAVEAVVAGRARMALEFGSDFSNALAAKLADPLRVSDDDLEDSQVRVVADMSDQVVGAFAQLYLVQTYGRFMANYSAGLGHNSLAYGLPVQTSYMFGGGAQSYRDFVAPPLLIQLQYTMAMVAPAFAMLGERLKVTMDRELCAGVRPLEILLTHGLVYGAHVVVQAVLTLLLAFNIYGFPMMGDPVLVLSLFIMEGLNGMLTGTVLALVCNRESTLVMFVASTFLTQILISGNNWPIEAMPDWMYYISVCAPQTLTIGSLRAIMFKGATILATSVCSLNSIGYMPQETALYGEFTVDETLQYYGQLYGMTDGQEIQHRILELRALLNIPDTSGRPVCRLSGGQQRLVSIAVTMIHTPALLMLDEPTVGVDSLIRYRIWQHLLDLCQNNKEEAQGAHTVGFIYEGKLLAQSNPTKLQQQYQCNTLEEYDHSTPTQYGCSINLCKLATCADPVMESMATNTW
ncbi:unnamed protein product [Medioppia subpectinata]|uniref:ABC transporter domain-containing protein n=1 Tax=Medioppia subpectinata TaxID=1979941 RepID=A0A7R9Q774_9ACAR|nr:unnamed protein product [Medioppia subpectinata]CAG2115441.1 unnamed protein product [Medioppia subpectinata]